MFGIKAATPVTSVATNAATTNKTDTTDSTLSTFKFGASATSTTSPTIKPAAEIKSSIAPSPKSLENLLNKPIESNSTQKLGGFAFGTPTINDVSKSGPAFTTATNTSSSSGNSNNTTSIQGIQPTGGFSFGISSASNKTLAADSVQPGFSFGSSAPKGLDSAAFTVPKVDNAQANVTIGQPTLPGPTVATVKPSTNSFMFGAQPSEKKKVGFSFSESKPAESKPTAVAPVATMPVFGSISNQPIGSIAFGGSSASTTGSVTDSPKSFIFGSPATGASLTPASNTQSSFGAITPAASVAPASNNFFSSPSAVTQNSSPFSMTATTTISQNAPVFGATNTATTMAQPSSTAFMFGASSANTAGSNIGTPTFGQSGAAAPAFGQTNAQLQSFGSFGSGGSVATPATFGSSNAFGNVAQIASATTAPAFGASFGSSVTPSFGNNATSTGSAFGAPTATTSLGFGVTPTPTGFTTPSCDEPQSKKLSTSGFNSINNNSSAQVKHFTLKFK